MTDEERYFLIKYRLDEASESINDVELLIANGRFRAANNRIYYGIFYCLLALGVKYGFETSKHQQLIGWFNKTFIKDGLIDVRLGRIVNKAYNVRTKGDYDSFVELDYNSTNELFEEMKDFISHISDFVKQ